MKWRRNPGAKLTILVASLFTLATGWALVRLHPPAYGADQDPTAAEVPASFNPFPTTSSNTVPQAVPRPHTRTRTS
jgi:hypothetical protein